MQIANHLRWQTLLVALTALVMTAVACSSGADPTPISATSTPLADITTPTPAASATQTPVTEGSTPQPDDTPSSVDGLSPELIAFLGDVDARMAEIRGIPVADPVPFRFLDGPDLNAWVRAQIDDEETLQEIEIADGFYTLLGLIPPDANLFDEYAALLDSQVLGAYDPEVEEFVVLQKSSTFGPSQEFTYAHEYIHRLQDARFGLDEMTERFKENSDRSTAFTALVEGDATTSQQIYALRHLNFAQLSQIIAEAEGAISSANNTPYILRRGLEFPYIEGASFVDGLRRTNGVSSINDAFAVPPDSTEQVLHADKYANRELPIEVSLPETLFGLEGAAGPEWEIADTDVLGEFFLRTWLEGISASSGDAAEAAKGWGGDAIKLAVNGDGDYAFAAKIVWDDPEQDSAEFFVVLTSVMARSSEFTRLDIGPSPGVLAFEGAGGVIVVSTLANVDEGKFTAVAAAPELEDAMALMLALAG